MKNISFLKKEETLNTDIEVLKHQNISSQKQIGYLYRESDEINNMDMSDDK